MARDGEVRFHKNDFYGERKLSKRKGNDKRSVIESQSIDLNEGIETRPSEIRSSKIVDREQINSSVNRERSQLPIDKETGDRIDQARIDINREQERITNIKHDCVMEECHSDHLRVSNTKRKDKYELIDEIMSANKKGKIYVDKELQISNTTHKGDQTPSCNVCKKAFKWENHYQVAVWNADEWEVETFWAHIKCYALASYSDHIKELGKVRITYSDKSRFEILEGE